MATRTPATYDCPATRWRLDALGAALCQRQPGTRSRSSLWRLVEDAARQPPRRVYGLNSHDPALEAQAHALCSLDTTARRFCAQGRLGLGREAKTGRQILARQYPPQPLAPGKPEKREPEDIRHGTRALIASCVVPPGQVVWHLGPTRTSAEFAAHWAHVIQQLPAMHRSDWVGDKLTPPWSLDLCRLGAQWCQGPWVAKDLRRGRQRRAFLRDPPHTQGGHFPPQHGSWLTHVALWCSVLARRCLQRGDCGSAQDFATRLGD